MLDKKPVRFPYLILFVLHLLLALVAFKDYRIHPNEIVFNNYGDGLKNYFTLLSYVKEPVSDGGYFAYNVFNYPFGEYIYTTDNTPLFAIAFKWFCHNIYDASDYTIPVYNLFIVLNIILCGLLSFAVLKRTVGNNWLSFLMSLVLPWINLQVVRIWRGHFNLSLSSLLLLVLLLALYFFAQKSNRRKQILTGSAIVLLLYFSFLLHGYYIAISGIFLWALLFFFGIYHFKSKDGKFATGASIIIPLLAIILSVGTLMATDGFYPLRSTAAGGYDWMEIKVRFGALYSRYDFHKSVFFPLQSRHVFVDAENTAYLGNVGLYAFLFFIILAVASKKYREKIVGDQKYFFRHPVLGSVFFASLVMLFISFGERYYIGTDDDGFVVYNFLNPLYLLHNFTDAVEQFRALGRFAWPFFWGFNIWMLYSLARLYPFLQKGLKYFAIAGVIVVGGFEVKDYIDAFQGKASQKNYLNPEEYKRLSQLDINAGEYQAMLSLPYYNAGAENSDIVIDDFEDASRFSYQMALHTGLPLMNVKLARTVEEQAMMLENLIANDVMSAELHEKMNSKPVLVFLYKDALTNQGLSSVPHNRPAAEDIYRKALRLPERLNLQAIDSLDGYVFYKWYPKK